MADAMSFVISLPVCEDFQVSATALVPSEHHWHAVEMRSRFL